MSNKDLLEQTKKKLIAERCCGIDDLAPCGEYRKEGDFVISANATPPTPEEFDEAFSQY